MKKERVTVFVAPNSDGSLHTDTAPTDTTDRTLHLVMVKK